jgi:hypothetical protein
MYALISVLLILVFRPAAYSQNYVSRGSDALHRAVYEIELNASGNIGNPYFDTSLEIVFTRPDKTTVKVDGFFDGGKVYRGRAYCDQLGEWKWLSNSEDVGLHNKSGSFRVVASGLKGKLRLHPEDNYQFAYDNGDWFLHIGDTGYRFVVQSEPEWKPYIDQAVEMGATKIRTWFAQSRGNVEALFTARRDQLALDYWKEIERRITYSLEKHPHVILQLIIYAEEIKRYYQGDEISQYAAKYAQSRWSSFPNIHWEISNDREIGMDVPLRGRMVDYKMIDKMGSDMDAREPWGTLITNQQNRFAGYSHVYAPWSDIITLEDEDQDTGSVILDYRRKRKQPVVLDEDRYGLYRYPGNRRYYFRRLMWASLLSGGHATYGGLKTYEPYDGNLSGVSGYFDANKAGKSYQGAHDFKYIHQFFKDAKLTLVNMNPQDGIVGSDPLKWKCIHHGGTYIVYLANPDGSEVGSDNPQQVYLKLPYNCPKDIILPGGLIHKQAIGPWERTFRGANKCSRHHLTRNLSRQDLIQLRKTVYY